LPLISNFPPLNALLKPSPQPSGINAANSSFLTAVYLLSYPTFSPVVILLI
jgi:hypothetical protein